MSVYTIIIENKAQKEFLKLNPPLDGAVKSSIDKLAKNPRPHGVKKLTGTKDGYRIRVADYRILYTIDDKCNIVTIYRIRHRKEVYE
jgi:mRNA interferase RelE/StbE